MDRSYCICQRDNYRWTGLTVYVSEIITDGQVLLYMSRDNYRWTGLTVYVSEIITDGQVLLYMSAR